MLNKLVENYYTSGCREIENETERCDDCDAEFFTVYELQRSGISRALIDCCYRADAELFMRVINERDELEKQRDGLVAENFILLPKAASELSNAWLLNKYCVGISAALMHLEMGRASVAKEWLYGTISGPGLERPELEEVEDIDAWAEHQNRGSISHSQALEIIKSEVKTTDAAIAEIGAKALDAYADTWTEDGSYSRIAEHVREYANKLRGGGV